MTKTTKSYSELLKEELLDIARRLGLTNLSRLRKDEIIDLVVKARAQQEKASNASRTKAKAAAAGDTPHEKAPRKGARPGAGAAKAAKGAKGAKAASVAAAQAAAPKRPKRTRTRSQAPASAAPHLPPASEQPRPSPLGPVSAQTSAQASKYTGVSPYRLEELTKIDSTLEDLPESYGDNRIVLLPRDISWLFTYWDLTEEYKEAARAAGGSVLALRLYDVTGVDFDGTNAHAMYEHECAEWARSWYLPTPVPDRDFVVEIGYRGGEQWFPLARSNKVSVPADQPSTWIKDDFISIRFDEDLRQVQDRLRLEGEGEHRVHAAAPPLANPGQTIFDDGEVRIMVGGTFLPPSGAPNLPLFSGSEYLPPGSQAFIPGSQAFIPGSQAFVPGSQAFVPGSQAFVPGSQAFIPGSQAFVPGSQAFVPGSYGFLPSSPGFMRPRVPVEELDVSAQPHGVPGAQGAAGDSSDGEPQPEPPVLLTTMEMIISGKSEPGADLRIAGRAIPLGPDGCFSLRITVPEGLRELPIEARSPASPEPRRITLRLGRGTE